MLPPLHYHRVDDHISTDTPLQRSEELLFENIRPREEGFLGVGLEGQLDDQNL